VYNVQAVLKLLQCLQSADIHVSNADRAKGLMNDGFGSFPQAFQGNIGTVLLSKPAHCCTDLNLQSIFVCLLISLETL
jgi:hypothetical protein